MKTAKATVEDFIPNPKLKLREQLREVMRFKHMSIRTEETYWMWIRGFILFHGKRHPREMGAPEVQAFLNHLAVNRNVAVSTQNQALNAIVFLYRSILRLDLGEIGEIERPKRRPKIPTVLSKEETRQLLAALSPDYQLIGQLLYGTGMRLLECLRLRVKDIDFAPQPDHHPRRQGSQGPGHNAAGKAQKRTATAPEASEVDSPGRSSARPLQCLFAGRAGSQIPQCTKGMVLAIRVPGSAALS